VLIYPTVGLFKATPSERKIVLACHPECALAGQNSVSTSRQLAAKQGRARYWSIAPEPRRHRQITPANIANNVGRNIQILTGCEVNIIRLLTRGLTVAQGRAAAAGNS